MRTTGGNGGRTSKYGTIGLSIAYRRPQWHASVTVNGIRHVKLFHISDKEKAIAWIHKTRADLLTEESM